MKILYINKVCGAGSTGRIVTDLMQQAKAQGYTVKVACSAIEPIRGVTPDEVITVGSKWDYYVHNILSRLTDKEGLFSKAATRKLVRQIQDFNPDIIHLHNLHGHWINYEILFDYLSQADKKVIWTLHDCWAFTGHCAHFSLLKCEQWKTHCKNCPGLSSYPKCYGKGNVYQNFARKKKAFTSVKQMTLVTPSKWLAGLVRQSFLGKYNVEVIYNGIDLTIFQPTSGNFRERYALTDKPLILGVAQVWIARKGLPDLLALARKMKNQAHFVLVGLTKKQLAMLPPEVLGLERTNTPQDLAAIYSAADVFVNPSYEETMGLVTAEALACGTPAVVYDQTAVPEVVDSASGVIVPAGNIDQLEKAVTDLLTHPLAKAGILTRAMRFEKTKQYEQYIKIYEQPCKDVTLC